MSNAGVGGSAAGIGGGGSNGLGGASGAGAGGTPSSSGGTGGNAGMQSAGAGQTNGGSAGSPSGGNSGTAGSAAGGSGMGGGSGGMAESGGAGAGAGSAGATNSAGAAGTGALSFARDIWPVFDKVRDPVFVYRGMGSYEGCTATGVCHGGEDPGAELYMPDAPTAYDDLLNVPALSNLCGDTVRVIPGNPDESCLILFYVGRLKDDLQWVDEAEVDLVRRWIAEGAEP
jgi:hypothetical protein